MSIASKLNKLIEIKDSFINSFIDKGYIISENATLTDMEPLINNLIETGEITDNSKAKGYVKNTDILWTLDANNYLEVTGTDTPPTFYGDTINPFRYIASDIQTAYIDLPATAAFMFGQSSAFTNLTSVTLSNNIVNILEYTFRNCTALTTINLSNVLTTINGNAFDNTNITNITFPNTLTTISSSAFENSNLSNGIILPSSLTTIGNKAFRNTKTQSIITNSPLKLTNSCFAQNQYLTTVNLYEGTIAGDADIFYNCTALTTINLPISMSILTKNMFYGCTALTTINFNTVFILNEQAFCNCSSLTTLNISNTLTSIGKNAFYGCTGLSTVTIPYTLSNIDSTAFTNCDGITFNIYKEQDSISNAPWGCTNATVNWLGTPTFNPQVYSIEQDFPITQNLLHYFDFTKTMDGPIAKNSITTSNDFIITGAFTQIDNSVFMYGNANSKADIDITGQALKAFYIICKGLKNNNNGNQWATHIFATSNSHSTSQYITIVTLNNGMIGFDTYDNHYETNINGEEYHIIAIRFDRSTIGTQFYIDGTLIKNYGVNKGNIGTTLNFGHSRNGRYRQNPFYLRFFCAYDELHTEEQVQQMSTYLMNKFINN